MVRALYPNQEERKSPFEHVFGNITSAVSLKALQIAKTFLILPCKLKRSQFILNGLFKKRDKFGLFRLRHTQSAFGWSH